MSTWPSGRQPHSKGITLHSLQHLPPPVFVLSLPGPFWPSSHPFSQTSISQFSSGLSTNWQYHLSNIPAVPLAVPPLWWTISLEQPAPTPRLCTLGYAVMRSQCLCVEGKKMPMPCFMGGALVQRCPLHPCLFYPAQLPRSYHKEICFPDTWQRRPPID